MRIRNIEKSFYLSKKEDKLLQDKCKKLNLNQSEYIREMIDDYEPKKYDGSIFEMYENDLKNINLKLKSILETANRYGYIDKMKIKYNFDRLNYIIDDIEFSLKVK